MKVTLDVKVLRALTCLLCATQARMGILEGLGTCLPDTVTPGAVAGYLAVFSLCNQTVNQNVVACCVPNGVRAQWVAVFLVGFLARHD